MSPDNDLINHLALIYRNQGPAGVINNLSFLYGAFVLTGDHGRLRGASDDFCAMVGYAHDEIVDLSVMELVAVDERDGLRQRIEARDESRYELKLLSRSGEIHHVRVTPRIFYIDDEAVRLAEFIDVTETSKALHALRESETKFRAVFKLAAVGIARLRPDGSWLECNDALCAIVGYSEKELTAMTFQDITHPDDLDDDLAFLTDMLAGKRRSYSMQKRYFHKQGHTVWINLTVSLVSDDDGNPAYLVSLIDDITALKDAQNQLEQNAESFRGLADSLPLAVVVNDPPDEGGACHYANPCFTSMFGYDEADIPTLADWWPLAFPDSRERKKIIRRWTELARDATHSASEQSSLETATTGKDGRVKNVRWTFAHSGGLNYAFGLDVTAEKQLKDRLTRENAQLEHLSLFDQLTGVANRRQFDQSLEAEWRRARRHGSPLSLIMVDIDFFKKYNDHYGHVDGDACLKRVASALADTLNRGTDLVARYGGEEFAILLPYTPLEDARRIAEACRERVHAQRIEHAASSLDPHLTISLGVASTVPTGTSRPLSLVDEADDMLYAAKDAGRNCVMAQAELAEEADG